MSDDFFNFKPFYDFVAGHEHYHTFTEIGVYTGASLAYLGERLKQLRPANNWSLTAVDLWNHVNERTTYDRAVGYDVYEAFWARMHRTGLVGKVVQIIQESSKAAEKAGMSDFVFIDANHAYEFVKADIAAWLPKVNPGGMISGHDYGEPCGVKQAVDEAFPDKLQVMGTCWYHYV